MAELFNRDNLPNRHAVDELLARPELGPAFEQKYGPGTAFETFSGSVKASRFPAHRRRQPT